MKSGNAVKLIGLAVALSALLIPQTAAAQVGLSSNVARVALVARVSPKASIPSIRAKTDGSVMVQVSANTAYRLVVVATPSPRDSRLWVRGAGGQFQELAPGSSVTVAEGANPIGNLEREVSYRFEAASGERATEPLPVRYEIVVNPTI